MPVAEVIWGQLPFFAGLPAQLAEELRAAAQLRTLRRREVALRVGELGVLLAWVVRGRVQGLASTPDAREFAVSSFGPGSHFGDLEAWGATVAGQRGAVLHYVATAESTVVVVAAAAVAAAAQQWPALWQRLLQAALAREAEWLRWRQWWSLPNAVERVVAVLAWLGEQGDEGRLPEGITQQEIAGYANTTRETVTRVMQRLQQEGRLVRSPTGWLWQG